MRVKLLWKNEPMKPATGLFRGGRSGGNAHDFEAEINAWLHEHFRDKGFGYQAVGERWELCRFLVADLGLVRGSRRTSRCT